MERKGTNLWRRTGKHRRPFIGRKRGSLWTLSHQRSPRAADTVPRIALEISQIGINTERALGSKSPGLLGLYTGRGKLYTA